MALKVQVSTPQRINTNVKKVSLPLVNLEELKNVNSADLEDGYTLIWNESEQQWVTQQITASAASNIDGGTY
jgi:hypothetical protein